jgi:hypothetical protein
MTRSTRIQLLSFVTAGAFVALAAASIPAYSEEPSVNRGPVKPYEPILTAVGTKRVIAFFEPNLGRCAVKSVVWDIRDDPAEPVSSAVQLRVSLKPLQIMNVDASENQTIALKCGYNALTLSVVDEEIVAAPAKNKR